MAAAAKHLFSNFHSNHRGSLPLSSQRKKSYKDPRDSEDRDTYSQRKEEEKRLICDWESSSSKEVLTPAEILRPANEKHVGQSSKHIRVDDFKLLKTIGTGTFARVWLVTLSHPKEGEQDKIFALKVLRKADVIKLKQVEHVRNERDILAAVAGHPFITTMVASFQDHDSLYMIMDYCPGGEVFTYLRRARRFDEPTSQFYAAEILLILEFLHEKEGVAYRDMKPENILLDAEGHIKLVDFGFAKKLGGRETFTLCGTPEYLAPETIRNTGHGNAVDWWAFGILIFEFLVGQPPFWDQNPMKIYEQIVEGNVRYPSSMAVDAKDLIGRLCEVNPGKRLGNLRGGASDIKNHAWFKNIDWEKLYNRELDAPIKPHVKHPSDTRNFEEYDDEGPRKMGYTSEMQKKWDAQFQNF